MKKLTEDWEQRKLETVCDIYDGTHQTPKYKNSGIMFLSVENIKTLNSNKYISEEAFEKDFKIFPTKNDILMTRIGDIGTTNIVADNSPKAYYVSLALFKNIKLDTHFLNTAFSSSFVMNDMWKKTLHIAFPKKINKNEISKIVLLNPNNRIEQKKIGNCFSQLDNLITLHQRKYLI